MNKLFKITIRFIWIFLSVMTYAQEAGGPVVTDHYTTKTFDCAIFPSGHTGITKKKRFTPTRNNVDKAEKRLATHLKIINCEMVNQDNTTCNPIIHIHLINYKRQYFGYIAENGDRILLINCFWGNEDDLNDWLQQPVWVLDGGSHYWNIKFNLETSELFDLVVNGNA